VRFRVARATANGACLGSGFATIFALLDWAARHGLGDPAQTQLLHLRILNSPFEFGFPFVVALFSLRTPVVLATIAGMYLLRPTRPLARTLVAFTFAFGAMACAVIAGSAAYILAPSIAPFLPLLSFLPAILLARRPMRPVAPLATLAAGLAIGAFAAQMPMVAIQPPVGVVSPLNGFLFAAAVSLLAAWVVSRWAGRRPARFSSGRFWGLCAFVVYTVFVIGYEAYALRARSLEGPTTRVYDGWAYDLHVLGDPPALLWTNRDTLQVLENPYGDAPHRYVLNDDAIRAERIWPAADGGFYLQADGPIGRWKAPSAGQPFAHEPAAWLTPPDWVFGVVGPDSPGTSVEDAATKRVLLVSAFQSHYAVMDRDTWTMQTKGVLSDTVWGWWYSTIDPIGRVALISAAVGDGGLYELNLDSLRVRALGLGFHVYEMVLDPPAGLLWGIRPITGEVLAIDRRTQEIRHRIPVEPTARDLTRDPDTGDLFTCALLSGDVFRIDPRTETASKIGWCGRFCRNLDIDSRRRTLWAATADGVCRIALDGR
jgi:hypothetical protein